MKPQRVILGVALFLVLAGATGFVLTRNRRMSLMMEAKDRILAGDGERKTLRWLEAQVDWDPLPSGEARRIVDQLGPRRSTRVIQGGAYALVFFPDETLMLAERLDGTWTRIR